MGLDKVLIGKIIGTHGRPGPSVLKYKVSLFSYSSNYMENLRDFFISADENSLPEKLSLVDGPQSMGAKWGHSKEILLSVSPEKEIKKGSLLWIDRKNIPQTQDNEYLISDFMGLEILDENQKRLGKVIGCEDNFSHALHQNLMDGVNLVVEIKPQVTFAVPFGWLDSSSIEAALKTKKLIVPGIEAWMNFDPLEKADDQD